MHHNISNPKWFGVWSRLEDDFLYNDGTDSSGNFVFSKMEKTGGLFGSIISLATAFPACDPETGHATPWQQALGERLLRLRVEKSDYPWILCPNSESAVNMMNMVMDAHMPKDFFDGFVCGDEEYGLDEEAHEMASGRKEIDTQTETKDAPVKDTQNIE